MNRLDEELQRIEEAVEEISGRLISLRQLIREERSARSSKTVDESEKRR